METEAFKLKGKVHFKMKILSKHLIFMTFFMTPLTFMIFIYIYIYIFFFFLQWKSIGYIKCLVTGILQNIFFCVQQKKEIHTGLK